MDELKEIQQSISTLPKSGRRPRFGDELRDQILSYAQGRRRQGFSVEQIAAEVGMKWRTLQRWYSELKDSRFRRVQVVTEKNEALIVHGPSGIRIEGLDLDQLAELIRRLA